MLVSDISNIQLSSTYKSHLQSSNKKYRKMHPTGISLYFTFDIFDTILYKCLNIGI